MRRNIFEIKKGRVNGVVKRGMGFNVKLSAFLCPGLLNIRNDEWTFREVYEEHTKTTQADKEKRLRCAQTRAHLRKRNTFLCFLLDYCNCLVQRWANYGPRAISGPLEGSI
ncbi:hypothetical protein CEXT_591431 [Caerostris extrusa]|uniref:Uncharacterized protein n=1 Tax=Caerostris extrusa TaxID=172846 RepID=A0AAV4TSB0_CAEEX|nr:hypothetical protein CEXT_591431 [Caerostris extrusa]